MIDREVQLAAFKRGLRRDAAAAREGIDPLQREEWSLLVCRHAWNWLEAARAESLMAYVSFRSELDTGPLIERCWEDGRQVILPRVRSGSGELSLHKVDSWSELVRGTYGISEPSGASPAITEGGEPEVVFVPGLAFDAKGGRLGYGRGYYDRLCARLSGTRKHTVWIGLAYGVQLLPEVPMESHDAYMDMLITEEGVLNCRREGD